jgi:hypothetical protein
MREDFYESALTAENRARYHQARTAQGLQGEIALLRLRLYQVITQIQAGAGAQQADSREMARLVDLLIKALQTQGTGSEEEYSLLGRALEEEARRILDPGTEIAEKG